MKNIKSTAIIAVTAVLLVACAAGGGGGGSAAGPSVSAFSHNGYTFAPNIAGDAAIGTNPQTIGRVFPNDNFVRGLVAARLGMTDPQEISALAVNTNYRVSYSIDAVAGSSTAIFFSIKDAIGEIEVSNPAGVGSGLTYDEIRAFVGNSITVKQAITVINPQPSASAPGPNLGNPIENTVRVNLLNADAAITDNARGNVLSYRRGDISTRFIPASSGNVVFSGGGLRGTAAIGSSATGFPTSASWAAAFTPGTTSTDVSDGDFQNNLGNVFAANDLHNSTHLTRNLLFTVSLTNSSGGSYPIRSNRVSFTRGTALNIIDAAVGIEGSFLYKVDALITEDGVSLFNGNSLGFGMTWSADYSYTRVFNTNPKNAEIILEVEGTLNENNQLSAEIPISGFANNPMTSAIINRYRISRSDPQSAVTIFYGLRTPTVGTLADDSTDEECANGAVYIDNNDLRIKAGTAFDYETDDQTYNCRLAASVDGEDYYPLAFVVNDNAGTDVDSPRARQDKVFQIKDQANSTSGCSSNEAACYYADLTITIEDVNEAPTVELVGRGSDFNGSTEGVGVLSTYISVAGTPYQESLATDEAKVNDINLRINDEDSGQATVGEISLTVAPNHPGIGAAFSVQRPSGDNPDGYELVVNTTLLDYEEFSSAQLTADDKAIYQITITARDNNTASLASTDTFNFEVVDVKYPPVFVDPAINPRTYSADTALAADAAFVKEMNIINGTAGTPLYLLSGVRAFERHRIGRLAAVDPETGSGAGIVYTIVEPRSTVIHSNLQLIANTAGNNRGRRLIVAGGGLTETTAATPVTLQVAAPSGATRTLDIDLVVDNSRYADEEGLTLNPAVTPEITFDSGLALVGSAAEESPASDNTIISFRNTAESPPESVGTLNDVSTDNNGSLTPTFALLPASAFNGIASFRSFSSDINQPSSSSNLGAGIENFVINSTDGRISVRPSTAAFRFPAVFTLPVLVTPTPATGAPRFIAGMSDITIVTIATNDVNTPPQASAGRTQLNLTNKLTAQVNENLPVMTELARFTITDDNQALANGQPTAMFSGATASNANTLLLLDLTKNTDGSTTASISSRIEFDYENPTHRNTLQNLVIDITDAGSFTLLNSTTMQLLPAPIATNTAIETLEVAVEITLQDAIENPVLAAGNGTSYSISESASQNAPVAASGNQVVAMLNNALDFPTDAGTGYNASRINFSVSGDFAGILEVTPAASPDGNGMLALGLTVADPIRLENLGDGLTFTATIVATADSNPRLADRISIDVTITNDPANSNIKQSVIDTALAQLSRISINEQDVVRRSTYPIPDANFSISLTDLAADADEFFQFNGRPTTRRLVVPELALEAVAFATPTNLNPAKFIATANILNLELGRDNIYRLSIGDTDFIERTLFGDLIFDLVATSPEDSYTADPRGTIVVTPAAPKNVVYAAAATATPATPPVYALSYAQTPYAETVANISEVSPITIDATTAFSTALRGVAADSININATDEVYNTLALNGASGRFIARDYATAASLITSNDNLGNIQLNTDNKLVINFATATNDLLDFPRGFDILKPGTTGNLVDARVEFNAYFDLTVNNTASPKHISISQKVFTQTSNTSLTYNALDTIQLYRGATETYTLNYFIRAKVAEEPGVTGASNYALAQFSVAVAADGVKVAPEITGFVADNPDLDPATFSYDTTPVAVTWTVMDNSQDANTITQTLVSSDTSVCSVGNPTPTFVSPTAVLETFTSTVDALSPGTCTLTITATEGSASNDASITIVFPNLPPTVTTASLTNSGNDVDIGSGLSSGYRANAVGGSFVVTVNAENVDPGDDDPRNPDVSFTQTGGGSCTISEPITSANYANSIATAAYTITNPTGGACGAITISVNEEDTQGANQDVADTLVIPADTFIFDSAPTLNLPATAPVFAAYAAPITFEVTAATNDAGAAAGTVTIAVTTPSDSCTATASAIADGVSTITVDALSPGTCTLTITATEDSASNDATINIVFPNLPPTVTTASLTNSGNGVDIGSGFSTSGHRANAVGGSFVVTINAENVDPGDDDPRNPDVSFTQTGGGSCTIAEPITSANYANSIATAAYTITNPAGGACGSISISVNEEDTQGANQDIAGTLVIPANTFIFDTAPTLNRPNPEPVFADYATPITFEVTAASNDADAAAGTVTIAVTTPSDSCTATASAIVDGVSTITVDALSPGTCTLTITAAEDGASSDATINIVFPNLPPTVTTASLRNSGNDVNISSGFSTSGYRANAVGGSFVITINATNRDPGDDDSRDPDVAFTQTGGDSCTIAESITTANYANSIATAAYNITNPSGGACGEIAISVNEEDTQGANQDIAGMLVIPANTFIFDRAPTLNRPDTEPVFADYATPITFEVTAASNDAGAAAGTVTIAATTPSDSCTATASAIANGASTITVTPTATGLCSVNVTATEDGIESNEAFSFTLSEIAPLISIVGQTSPYTLPAISANENTIITLTATKQDISNTGVEFIVASNPGGCLVSGTDLLTSYTGAPFAVPLPNTATVAQDITISLPAGRLGQGGTCEIDFTAIEGSQRSDFFRVIASFNPIGLPPLIAITAGATSVNNLLAIPGSSHEITVTATKQDADDIDEVMFTTSFVGIDDTQHCDVNITNPTASYVGDGVGSIATTNITISYGGPLSTRTRCRVNVAVKEGTKTNNLPLIGDFNYAIFVEFRSVNQPPLLELFGVPTGNPFPDERPRIGVQATKRDDVSGGISSSGVMVINGACMAILNSRDVSYPRSAIFGSISSPAYYNIILDAANAVSADAADRQCEIEFSATETESFTFGNDPSNNEKTTNRTVVLSFAQELPPLFVNISTSSGSSVTSPSNRDVLVNLTLQKQDASNTRDFTLPDTINSVGDVCTATLSTPARYAATSIGSVATATYAVRINNVAISVSTACGEFIFTAAEGSATASSTASASPAITFTPTVELPPAVVLNTAASTIDDLLNSETATIAVTITKQDNLAANLAVTGVISGASCSIRELTNTGYGANPVLGSMATASYEVNYTGGILINGTCRVNIVATEDDSSGTFSQEVAFNFSNVPPSAVGSGLGLRFLTKEDYTNGITRTITITDGDPDDGERPTVSYTALPGGCRVANPSISSFVGATATATFTVFIDIRGEQPLNSVLGCIVRIIPTEVVVGTDTSLTLFTANHLPPLVSVPDTAASIAGVPVELTVTATKQDPGFTTDIEFATNITASADCTVTAGAVTLGSPTNIGNTYTRTYSVEHATAGNCTIPKSSFTVTEDAAVADGGTGNVVISFIPDSDGDGVNDRMDVDTDGDGLIELRTAAQLDMMRNNLFGTGLDANNSDGDVNAGGNDMGCGGAVSITTCNGYELVADIDLAAAGYDNWDPIGGESSAFRTIFEGNDYKVNNLKIQIDVVRNGWGFFSSITDATIRNVHLRDVNITLGIDNTLIGDINTREYPELIGDIDRVGGLVGSMANSSIIDSSAVGPLVAGGNLVGGLVGRAEANSQIVSSYAEFSEVNATYTGIGGLIGQGENIDIKLSYAVAGNIVGQSAFTTTLGVGGLVGTSRDGVAISSSLALVANITNIKKGRVGGLIGRSSSPNYAFLAAIVNNINTGAVAGGFVGQELGRGNDRITSSYVLTNHISGGSVSFRGGFFGFLTTDVTTRSSYWDNTTLSPPDTRTLVANAVGKPTTELQGTRDFTGIYEEWANGWCDAATNEFTTDPSHPLATIPDADANRFWDLGTSTEYPAMNCLPNFTPAEQRAAMAKALNGESPIRNLR